MINTAFDRIADATVRACTQNSDCSTGLPNISANNGNIQIILQWVFGVIAGVAVLIIVIGGLRLVFAARDGDPGAVGRMRNTIVFAGIGLVVALLADVIVTFVLGRI